MSVNMAHGMSACQSLHALTLRHALSGPKTNDSALSDAPMNPHYMLINLWLAMGAGMHRQSGGRHRGIAAEHVQPHGAVGAHGRDMATANGAPMQPHFKLHWQHIIWSASFRVFRACNPLLATIFGSSIT